MVKNLKKLRLQAGISQQKLAEIIGISQQSVNKYENHNIEPDIDTLIDLASFFKTSVDYLIGHTDINHIIEELYPYDLNDEESKLVDEYRKLTKAERQSINDVIKNYNINKTSQR